jgi:tyrosine ammonia-lyase
VTACIDTDKALTIDTVAAIADGAPVTVGDRTRARMAASERFAREQVDGGRGVYGWTTGFGPFLDHNVGAAAGPVLQRRLLAHLATGTGAPLPTRTVRAVMAARLGTLALGTSAARPAVADQLAAALNDGVVPVVPAQGTVGASGDLTPLAHIALALTGEGEADVDGARLPAATALERCGLAPLALAGRDGLALVNGTSAMTGVAALNSVAARRACETAILHAALYTRVMGGTERAFDARLGAIRPHPGQQHVHTRLTDLLDDPTAFWKSAEQLQDPYTLRCAPQILGAVHDQLGWHDATVATELGSVTDNPIFLPADEAVIHGGNFQGQHVAFAADGLSNAVLKIAELAERRLARVTDPALNNGLPAFLAGGTPGLDSGFMGAQVTASALLAEMRTKAVPASVQSVPTNANNQDIVSMGTIAARKTADLLNDCFKILAIEAMALTQAAELRAGGPPEPDPERPLASWCAWVRAHSPALTTDRPLAGEIGELAARLQETSATRPWVS